LPYGKDLTARGKQHQQRYPLTRRKNPKDAHSHRSKSKTDHSADKSGETKDQHQKHDLKRSVAEMINDWEIAHTGIHPQILIPSERNQPKKRPFFTIARVM